MKYLLMIYTNEVESLQMSETEQTAEMMAYYAYDRDTRQHGLLVGGDALMPATMATTVRVRNGKTLITDGPFAETKEQLGGYYLLDCKDLDQALEWAAKIPSALHGSIEVRPIMELPPDPHTQANE